MSDLDWQAPSRRHYPLPEPTEEVSPELHRGLKGWLQQVLLGVAPHRTPRPRTDYGTEVRQIMLRLGTDKPPWELPADAILDAVHTTLFVKRWTEADDDALRELVDMLASSNSLWRVKQRPDGRQGLERAVDETVAAAAAKAVGSAQQQAADHLREAWRAAYGRDPDPDKAFNEAMRGVEEVACPLVLRKKAAAGTAGLGDVIGVLKSSQFPLWEIGLPDKTGQPRDVGSLVGMMETLWQAQVSRHGGSPKSRRQDEDEARAVVPLAAVLVHWLSTGVLRKKPSL
ncbi:hypothetical protein [Micromonospora purpureochromogenes]|uniref:Abortive infection C-terminus n=1 Tax=Micromonospora purpureochromogenes TaxID=47872 RepID=A0ABX2RNE2_9ACTN|nr:hypothetical protein [Micromonospora purpureochromogenes]NYF57876.1 hypothetical protein [Micromonospora purpureochromogenes]